MKDFARIHLQNLINFGILPVTFVHERDYDKLEQGDILQFSNIRQSIQEGNEIIVTIKGTEDSFVVKHTLSERQVDIMLKGGLINLVKDKPEPFFVEV